MHGFVACCAVAPDHGRAVGVLSNLEGSAGVMLEIERRLVEEVVGDAYSPPAGSGAAPPRDLAAYEGIYSVPPERGYRISLRDGRLWLDGGPPGDPSLVIPATEIRVIAPTWGVLIEDSPWPVVVPFELGSGGRAEWVTIGGRAARRIAV